MTIAGSVTLTPPWEGAAAPTPDLHGVHADAYFAHVFSDIGTQLLSLATENIGWLIFGIAVFLGPRLGTAIWRHYHPGDVFGRARDAQYAAEIEEVGS